MGRKVFITVLGTNYYLETKYYLGEKPNGNEITTRFVQEQLITDLCSVWTSDDIIYVLLTEDAEKNNWCSPAQKGNPKGEYKGLEEIIKEKQLNCGFEVVPIREGFSEKEIWDIFLKAYSKLKEEDEIYFDVTHAFRSIPMLIIVLINYAKFLKNIKVNSILYGAFEKLGPAYKVEKEIPVEDRSAPIIELNSFSKLQDWTSAAIIFEKAGSIDEIIKLLKETESIEGLQDFTQDIMTCRGYEIHLGQKIQELKKRLNKHDTRIVPFKEIKIKISEKLKPFKQDNELNGLRAVEFCIEHGMIQQGITLLIEAIITKVMMDVGIRGKAKLTSHKNRDPIHLALQKAFQSEIKIEKLINSEGSEHSKIKEKQEITEVLDKVYALSYKNRLFEIYYDLSINVRNDINHAGFRSNPKRGNEFSGLLGNYLKQVTDIFQNDNQNDTVIENDSKIFHVPPKMVLLFSHQLTEKQKEDARTNLGINEFIPLPDELQQMWSNLPPGADHLDAELDDIKKWLAERINEGDFLLVQGDFGATYQMVNWAKAHDVIPIYSTTERIHQENLTDEGVVLVSKSFEHVKFRRY